MGLFGFKKKKSDAFRPLTENEIQSRLYGDFRPPQESPKKSAGSSGSPTGTLTPAASPKTSGVISDFFPPGTEGGLKTPSETTEPAFSKPAALPPAAGSKMSDPARPWGDRFHSPVLQKNPGNNTRPSVSFLKNLSQISLSVLTGLVSLGLAFWDSVSRIPTAHRGKYGKWMPWMAGVAFLFLVMSGIQALNNQREVAMKNPKKPLPVRVTLTDPDAGNEAVDAQAETTVIRNESGGRELTSGSPSPASESTHPAPKLPAPAKSKEAGVSPQDAKTQPYVIQVATYVNLSDAEKMLEVIRSASFSGFVQSLKRQSGRTYHCVFVGRFSNFEEAQKALQRFKKQPFSGNFPDAFVRTLK